MYDYHSHSVFSTDAEFSIEAMIRGAIEKNLKEIAITDHIDYDYADPSIEFDFDHRAYRAELERVQSIFHGKIIIRHGLELGLQPHLVERYEQLIHHENPDFVICSMHTCKKLDLYRGEYFVSRTSQEAWEDYLYEMIHIVKTFNSYNVIGHLDLLRRYNQGAAEFDLSSLYPLFKELLTLLIENEKGIEINTSGYRTAGNMPLPSWDILKWYYDLGGKIITLGSDAHSPDLLAYQFQPTLLKLKEIGFKQITTFEKMVPQFSDI